MASQALLSTPEASHTFQNAAPSRTSSHSSSASALASTSSLYVTFKVLQLVNTFRKRVQTRVKSNHRLKKETSTRITEDFCQDFEREAFEEIDKYLGRKTGAHSRKRTYPNSSGRSNSPYDEPFSKRSNSKRTTFATAIKPSEGSTPSRKIEWLLDELNQSVKSDEHSLSVVAANDKLFVQRKTELRIERISLKELTQLLVVVKDLLNTLRRTPSSRSGVKTLSEGNELLDLSLDETNTANLEHLFLCLKDQLLRLLVARLVEIVHKHVIECQRDQNKRFEEWFFEFPDARHPLSTTWPWSIRPSLAVIWGVCWMFYDYTNTYLDQNGDMRDSQGQVIATRQQLEEFNFTNNFGQVFRHQGSHSAPADQSVPRSIPNSHSPSSEAIMTQPLSHHDPRGLAVATSNPHYPSSAPDQATRAAAGLAIHGTNNTYTAAPPAYAASAPPAPISNYWLPQEPSAQALGFQDNTYPADDVGQWPQLPPHSVPEQQPASFGYPGTLPPGSRNSTPNIRVITSDLPEFQQQPQDNFPSATSHSSNSTVPLEEIQQTGNYFHYMPFDNTHLSPHNTHFMHQVPQQQDMRTPPRSPTTPQATSGEQFSRKRRHSEMSEGAQVQPHPHSAGGSRSGSVVSLQPEQSGEDDRSPRTRTNTKQRPDPPVNTEGKYICNFSAACDGQIFDRKCEWSKHMDKHDRPYACQHPQCAKLQGFTYSGGLLRHEREVHGKHGGPKAALMCPHEDCKRHSGKGFTRKENLNEHIRRVHTDKQSQSQSIPFKRETTDAMPGAEEAETPASRISETQIDYEDLASPTHKRRRLHNQGLSERSASEGVEDLKHEVNRLRTDNAAKDERLVQMEMKLQQFEAAMAQMQQQQQQQQGQGQV